MSNMLSHHSHQPHPALRNSLATILAVVAVIVIGMGGWLWYGINVPASNEEVVVKIEIASGTGVKEIAQQLEDQGLIRSPFLFVAYAQYTNQAEKLKAGSYQVAKNSSLSEIVDQVVGGKTVSSDIRITVIEGWTAKEIKAMLKQKGLSVGEFDEVVDAGELELENSVLSDGKPVDSSLEGYLFPETYNVFPSSKSAEIIRKMVDTFDSKITDEMKQQIEASPYSFYELLTLASIVEKEVEHAEDRRVVAGIFFNRLDAQYPLESDATVSYGIGKKVDLTYEDLQSPSPYNTYQHVGLPIGPISNPSLDALQAVLNPTKTDYFFFLTTPQPEGKALFSETYEQHLKYKAQYYP